MGLNRRTPGTRETLAGTDRNHEGDLAVAGLMPRKPEPLVRLVEDDYDGAFDDMPCRFAAAA